MPTAEKVAKVNELTQKMAGAKAIYLADFTGLDVASVTALAVSCAGLRSSTK